MRTTLDLPENLLAEARKVSGARTKTETIIIALQALIKAKKLRDLWELSGKMSLDLDLKESRAR